jgi:hypothetical protein
VNFLHVRDHDSRMYEIERGREQRETSAVWAVEATGPLNWSMGSSDGPINEITVEVMNAGRIESGLVTVRARIDGHQVGESVPRTIPGGTIAAAVQIPITEPQPFRGELVLHLVDSRGTLLASAQSRIAWP